MDEAFGCGAAFGCGVASGVAFGCTAGVLCPEAGLFCVVAGAALELTGAAAPGVTGVLGAATEFIVGVLGAALVTELATAFATAFAAELGVAVFEASAAAEFVAGVLGALFVPDSLFNTAFSFGVVALAAAGGSGFSSSAGSFSASPDFAVARAGISSGPRPAIKKKIPAPTTTTPPAIKAMRVFMDCGPVKRGIKMNPWN